mgnify:CR=1 FL=1
MRVECRDEFCSDLGRFAAFDLVALKHVDQFAVLQNAD